MPTANQPQRLVAVRGSAGGQGTCSHSGSSSGANDQTGEDMNASDTNPLGPTTPAPGADLFTLEPLRTEGPDALRTEAADGIAEVRLRKLNLVFESLPPTTLICSGEDLYLSQTTPGPTTEPIPRGATVADATLTFLVPGSAEPHSVQIHPPETLKTNSETDTALFRAFLAKHHFLVASRRAAALVLALATACLPELSVDPDPDNPRRYFAFAP